MINWEKCWHTKSDQSPGFDTVYKLPELCSTQLVEKRYGRRRRYWIYYSDSAVLFWCCENVPKMSRKMVEKMQPQVFFSSDGKLFSFLQIILWKIHIPQRKVIAQTVWSSQKFWYIIHLGSLNAYVAINGPNGALIARTHCTLQALGAGVVHGPADQRHCDAQQHEEDPVFSQPGHQEPLDSSNAVWHHNRVPKGVFTDTCSSVFHFDFLQLIWANP